MIDYNCEYYYNLLRIQSRTAQLISNIRWEFINANIPKHELLSVLDYGCGVGFMKAFLPEHAPIIDTYDIMPVPQTGMRMEKYDLVMLYDVLEHIPDFTELLPILNKTKYVVLSIPIKPDNIPWDKYKHFKPGEHLHYFSHDLLEHMFGIMGFALKAKGTPECPPREFVWSYLFKRKTQTAEGGEYNGKEKGKES